MKNNWTYYSDTHALYVYVQEPGTRIIKTVSLGAVDATLDLDDDNNVIGVEILHCILPDNVQ